MLPRKRQRPNPALTPSSASDQDAPSAVNTSHASGPAPQPAMPAQRQDGSSTPDPAAQAPSTVHKARSWYGTWSQSPKATASTSVAKENILGGTVRSNKTPDFAKFDSRDPRPPSDAQSAQSLAAARPAPSTGPENHISVASEGPSETPKSGDESELDTTTGATAADGSAGPQRPTTSSGWLSWLTSTPFLETQTTTTPRTETPAAAQEPVQASTPAPTTASETPSDANLEPPPTTSWFGLWSTPTATAPLDIERNKTPEAAMEDQEGAKTTDAPNPEPRPEPAPKAGSTWAFWSRDSPPQTAGKPSAPNAGQIAVMGEGSEAQPLPMNEDHMAATPSKETRPKDIPAEGRSTWRRNKRARPESMDTSPGSPISRPSPAADSTSASRAQTPTAPEPPVAQTETSIKSTDSEGSTKTVPNLLLPSFANTYRMKENPSILKQITSLLLRAQQPQPPHVFRLETPPKIRKALSIGVHGLFPATYLRPMIGQPTGTSLRFATLGADAIRRWADAHGCADCEIEKVALEGDGKIGDRVDNLWKLMLNWIEHIRRADLIMVACHSQGVPVAVMLLEKLIDLGIVTDAKIGVCAMAGVALGPFPEYRSNLLMGSASELWEFGDPKSTNSQWFEAAMRRVLGYGVRITFVGSIDDQVVPMESAVYSPAHHPYIYRAVFIDGRIHAPDFIAHLVGLALKLRNLGISDHGLIRELSVPLAGSLYTGEGHSRLYYEPAVYDLAVTHTLETTSVPQPAAVEIRERGGLGAPNPNPYILPWIMRGMLEEEFVKTELSQETEELLRQFDDWKPTNKALKDVKYRLEAVRSRL